MGNTQNNQGFFHRGSSQQQQQASPNKPKRTSAQYHTNSILKTVSFSPFSTGLIFNPDLPTATIQASCSVSPCTREHAGSPKHRCNQHFGTFWKSLWTSYRRNIRQQYDKISMDVINELHTSNESLYHSLKFKKVGEFLEVFFPEKLDVFSTEILHSKFSFHNCSILPKHGYIRLMEINTPISCIRNLFELENWNIYYSASPNSSRPRAYKSIPIKTNEFQKIVRSSLLADHSYNLHFANVHAPACVAIFDSYTYRSTAWFGKLPSTGYTKHTKPY